MGANKLVTKICRKNGWLGPKENLDPETRLAKIAFVISQFSFTIITIGKKHASKIYAQFTLNTSCFWKIVTVVQFHVIFVTKNNE